MDEFLDSLSKKLAPTISRRSMLSIASRTIVASLVSSAGLNWLLPSTSRAQTNSLPSVCPSCGSCQECDFSTGQCETTCAETCATATLCQRANEHRHYRILYDYLTQARQFMPVGEPQSVIWSGDNRVKVLEMQFASPDQISSATLFFGLRKSRHEAQIIESVGGVPRYAYGVNHDGKIEQVLSPYATASVSTSIPSTTAVADLAARNAQALAGTIFEGSCVGECPKICNFLEKQIVCRAAKYIVCVEAGFGAVVSNCSTLIEELCSLDDLTDCVDHCNEFCGCPVGQVPGPGGTCSTPGCVSPYRTVYVPDSAGDLVSECVATCDSGNFPCPGGSCAATGTTCPCTSGTTSCGNNCCTVDQICTVGVCTVCPAGQTSCGNICCPAGDCINGACVTIICPPGAPPCGGSCCYGGGVCCKNAAGQFGCGFPGGTCCSTLGSCPPNTSCCISSAGGLYCCNPGEACCPGGGCSPGTC